MEFTFFANKKYVLTASYSFYILMHLFGILVTLYNVVGWRVGSDAASCCACESSEAHGCESWSSLLITVWKALSSSELVQLHFILAVPQAAWLIHVQDNDSWEALCGPWLWSRLCRAGWFITFVVFSRDIGISSSLWLCSSRCLWLFCVAYCAGLPTQLSWATFQLDAYTWSPNTPYFPH